MLSVGMNASDVSEMNKHVSEVNQLRTELQEAQHVEATLRLEVQALREDVVPSPRTRLMAMYSPRIISRRCSQRHATEVFETMSMPSGVSSAVSDGMVSARTSASKLLSERMRRGRHRPSSVDGRFREYEDNETQLRRQIAELEAELTTIEKEHSDRQYEPATPNRSRSTTRSERNKWQIAFVQAELAEEELRDEVATLQVELNEARFDKSEVQELQDMHQLYQERMKLLQAQARESQADVKAVKEQVALERACASSLAMRLEEALRDADELRDLLASGTAGRGMIPQGEGSFSTISNSNCSRSRSRTTSFAPRLFDEIDGTSLDEEEEASIMDELERQNAELQRELAEVREQLEMAAASKDEVAAASKEDADLAPGVSFEAAASTRSEVPAAKFRARSRTRTRTKSAFLPKQKGELAKLRDGVLQADLYLSEVAAVCSTNEEALLYGTTRSLAADKLDRRIESTLNELDRVKAGAVAAKLRFEAGAAEEGAEGADRQRAQRLAESLGAAEEAILRSRGSVEALKAVAMELREVNEGTDKDELASLAGKLASARDNISPLNLEAAEWVPPKASQDHDAHVIALLRHQVVMLEARQHEARAHRGLSEIARLHERLAATELKAQRSSRLARQLSKRGAVLQQQKQQRQQFAGEVAAALADEVANDVGDTGCPQWSAQVAKERLSERAEPESESEPESEEDEDENGWNFLVNGLTVMGCCCRSYAKNASGEMPLTTSDGRRMPAAPVRLGLCESRDDC